MRLSDDCFCGINLGSGRESGSVVGTLRQQKKWGYFGGKRDMTTDEEPERDGELATGTEVVTAFPADPWLSAA